MFHICNVDIDQSRYTLRAVAALAVCCCLGACHDSQADDFLTPEATGERVPIALNISNPQFVVSVVQNAPKGRRNAPGVGTLGAWDPDSMMWKDANFHVFAYQTQNELNGHPNGQCDMTPASDMQSPGALSASGSVLLYDRIMRVDSINGAARLYSRLSDTDPTTFYYPIGDQKAKYKFYAYYADNVEAQNIQRSDRMVTGELTIDGTQDVMHAFAYHTFDDFWNHIETLKERGVTDNELRQICNPDDRESNLLSYNNYLYSTVSAHRGLQPRFHLNRLMTRLNVYVAGGGVYGDAGIDDYKNIVITGMTVLNTRTKGTITIANDNWTETSYQADSMNIMRWSNTTESLQDLSFPIETKVPYNNDENSFYYDVTKYPQLASLPELTEQNHVNIQSTTPVRLVAPLLLTPSDSYTIHLDMLYAHRSTTAQGELDATTPYLRYQVESTVRLKDQDGTAYSFQQGREYAIIIYVYGPQEITTSVVSVDIDKPWFDGGTIKVDEEAGYVYEPESSKSSIK